MTIYKLNIVKTHIHMAWAYYYCVQDKDKVIHFKLRQLIVNFYKYLQVKIDGRERI